MNSAVAKSKSHKPSSDTPNQPAPRKSVGRPATGKRSDPDYESTTVFLRRNTKVAAAKLLLDGKGTDLSEVLEKLKASWVRSQQS